AMSLSPTPKRALIVSYWFQPYAAVASLRMGKLAKHLLAHGWDVRVLTADATEAPTMMVEIPKERITYTPWTDVDQTLKNMLGGAYGLLAGRKAPAAKTANTVAPAAVASAPQEESKLRAAVRLAYLQVVRWPDNRAGWIGPAVAAGDELIRSWRPDVMYAT